MMTALTTAAWISLTVFGSANPCFSLIHFKYDESLKIKNIFFHKLFLRHLAELSSVGYTRQKRFSTSSLKKSSSRFLFLSAFLVVIKIKQNQKKFVLQDLALVNRYKII
jgi:hypothetical protein